MTDRSPDSLIGSVIGSAQPIGAAQSALAGSVADRADQDAVSAETDAHEPPRALVSRRAYAKRIGWAPSVIIELVQKGWLSVFAPCTGCGAQVNSTRQSCDRCGRSADDIDWRRGKIDPEVADRELEHSRDHQKDYVRRRWEQRRARNRQAGQQSASAALPAALVAGGVPRNQASGREAEKTPDLLGAGGDDAQGDLERASFAQARERRERAEARLKELQLEEALGNLVRADLARQEQMRAARRVRDGVMAVPGHICYELAAEADPARVLIKLESELGAALRMIGQQLEGDTEGSGS